MKDILPVYRKWQQADKEFAVATVARVYGSAPRPLGSKMLISSDGEIAGSVSGGCVEGAVVDYALASLQSKQSRLVSFGISNQAAWEVGLACGGQIEVWIQPCYSHNRLLETFISAVEKNQPAALATVLNGAEASAQRLSKPDEKVEGNIADLELREQIDTLLIEALIHLNPERVAVNTSQGQVEVLIDIAAPQPRLVIVGAVHIADPLIRLAKVLGYKTVVIDARKTFATRERFPHADELIVGWPSEVMEKINIDSNTAVVTLTHDDKLDVPALIAALNSPARYIGALGSKRTHANRVKTLLEEGVPEELIRRIHAPVGLDLGGRSVEEIALAVLSEIVADRNGRTNEYLTAQLDTTR